MVPIPQNTSEGHIYNQQSQHNLVYDSFFFFFFFFSTTGFIWSSTFLSRFRGIIYLSIYLSIYLFIEDLTLVVISYEIYETSLRRVS